MTPKALFQSDDEAMGQGAEEEEESADDVEVTPPRPVDRERMQRLKRELDACVVNAWRKKMRRGDDPTPERPQEHAAGKAKARARPKATAKGKAKAQAKTQAKAKAKASAAGGSRKKPAARNAEPKQNAKMALSPSAKKEARRRKRLQEEYMRSQPRALEDAEMVNFMKDFVDSVRMLETQVFKDYHFERYADEWLPTFGRYATLSCYWKSCGVGVLWNKVGHCGHFSFNRAKSWSVNMGLALACAWIHAPR